MELNEMTDEDRAFLEEEQRNEALRPEPKLQSKSDPEETEEDAPEPNQEEQKPAKKPEEQVKQVPHQALHEERRLRKEADERARKAEETAKRVEERFNQWQAAQEQRERQAAMPEYDKDPAAYLKHQQDDLQRQQQALLQWANQQNQSYQQQAEHQHFLGRYAQDASNFAQGTPDFKEAYNFLLSARAQEYAAMGYDPMQSQQFLAQEEQNIAQKAYQDGVNPAERLYALAKARGFSKAQPGNGIDTLQRGVQAGKSLSNGNSGAPKGKVTLNDLANMTDEEFAKATAGDKWQKVAGMT